MYILLLLYYYFAMCLFDHPSKNYIIWLKLWIQVKDQGNTYEPVGIINEEHCWVTGSCVVLSSLMLRSVAGIMRCRKTWTVLGLVLRDRNRHRLLASFPECSWGVPDYCELQRGSEHINRVSCRLNTLQNKDKIEEMRCLLYKLLTRSVEVLGVERGY